VEAQLEEALAARTAELYLREGPNGIGVVGQHLGHQDLNTTRMYQRADPDRDRALPPGPHPQARPGLPGAQEGQEKIILSLPVDQWPEPDRALAGSSQVLRCSPSSNRSLAETILASLSQEETAVPLRWR
jgi:hypothetical protein